MEGQPAWNEVFTYTAPGRHFALRDVHASSGMRFGKLSECRFEGKGARWRLSLLQARAHIACPALLLPLGLEF